MRISVTLSDTAHLALLARATRERRPAATMASVILENELASEPPLEAESGLEEEPTGTDSASRGAGDRPDVSPPDAEVDGDSARSGLRADVPERPGASRKKKRTTMCEHRVPADQFCKRCDG